MNDELTDTDQILFRTLDPTVMLNGKPLPAMTTLLSQVCDSDPNRFQEAIRIVQLFIGEALKHDRT